MKEASMTTDKDIRHLEIEREMQENIHFEDEELLYAEWDFIHQHEQEIDDEELDQ
jgi:hypothetical protein